MTAKMDFSNWTRAEVVDKLPDGRGPVITITRPHGGLVVVDNAPEAFYLASMIYECARKVERGEYVPG